MKKKLHDRLDSLKAGWYIWLFPVIALGITAWLLNDYYKTQGPRIRIAFDDAASIQPEKTRVKFRGVSIGTVKDVYLSEDQKDVIAEVLLRKDAEIFAVEGTKFSLVTPKVGFQGISGLETLFEGTYIAMLPGNPDGKEKHDFKSTSSAATDPLDDTSAYLIESPSVESITVGDAVTFRGLKVGSVTKIVFAKGGQLLQVQVNIENRYTRFVRSNTVFWRKIGIQAKLGLFGSNIKINSMDSIMNGGVEFATPNEAGPMAKALHKFSLAPDSPKDLAKWNPFLD